MLKKAGIVVAAAAAGLLAVSPLAFAGDYDGDHDGGHHSHDSGDHHGGHHGKSADCKQDNSSKNGDVKQSGLVNVNDVTAQVPVQLCDNHVGILDGAVGILGSAKNEQNNG